jgi:HlyD family secretion protein
MDREIPKEVKRRESRRNWIKAGIGTAVGIGLLWAFIALLQNGVYRKDLQFSTVDRGTLNVSVSATGKVVPAFEEIINSPITSRILEVYHKGGDSVEVGTPILRLDLQSAETEYKKQQDGLEMKQLELEQLRVSTRNTLSQMAMKLKVSRMELDRQAVELRNERYLDSLGAGTTDKVREVELAYNVGRLQLEQDEQAYRNQQALSDADLKVKQLELNVSRKELAESQRTLEDARIRAPRRGILTYVNSEVGAQVLPGSRVAVVSDLSHFKVEGEIADTYADRIAPGDSALVRIGDGQLAGWVSGVTPLSRNGVISFNVQFNDAANRLLRSGLKADVYVTDAVKDNVLRLANGSYYTGRGEYELFVVRGDELRRCKVTLGDSNYDYVEVVAGLQPGDKVVVSDMDDYKSKSKLKLK